MSMQRSEIQAGREEPADIQASTYCTPNTARHEVIHAWTKNHTRLMFGTSKGVPVMDIAVIHIQTVMVVPLAARVAASALAHANAVKPSPPGAAGRVRATYHAAAAASNANKTVPEICVERVSRCAGR